MYWNLNGFDTERKKLSMLNKLFTMLPSCKAINVNVLSTIFYSVNIAMTAREQAKKHKKSFVLIHNRFRKTTVALILLKLYQFGRKNVIYIFFFVNNR